MNFPEKWRSGRGEKEKERGKRKGGGERIERKRGG